MNEWTIDVGEENFEAEVLERSNTVPVVVDFWAEWCGPCKSFAPVFETASQKYPDVVFGKINTEEQQELAAQFQIRSIPNVMLFREQVMLFTQPGAMPATGIDSVIAQAKALDMAKIRQEIAEEEANSSA
jgi:thioredoxin